MKTNKLLGTGCRPERSRHLGIRLLPLLAGTLIASTANAAGFGELTLHSRIGENLLAEVPLIGVGKEASDASCYALAPNPGSDLPVITKASIRLIHNKDSYRLLIVGAKPIAEPAFTISLRANCGIDLRHDYVLMPDAPTAPVVETIDRNAPGLETDAEPSGKKPRSPRAQRHASRSAPQAEAWDTPLPTQRNKSSRQVVRTEPAAVAPTGDRLMLSTGPLDLKPGLAPAPGSAAELEERLLKMETTMRTLNQEVEALDTSLQLATEMQSAKRELQVAQTLQQPTLSAGISPPPAALEGVSSANWLELLFSSLIGGSLAVGLAVYLSRQKQPARPTI